MRMHWADQKNAVACTATVLPAAHLQLLPRKQCHLDKDQNTHKDAGPSWL